MGAVVAGGVLNVFGDWFLVFPMNLGMSGAAIATAGGTIVQFIVLLCYLLKKQNRLRLVKPRQLSKAIMKSLSAGFSASILEFPYCLTCILNNQIMRYGGAVALSIFGVVLSCSGYVPTYLYRCGTGHSTDCCK